MSLAKRLSIKPQWIALLGSAILSVGAAQAQDNGRAILDALIQKGVLTAGEAQDVLKQAAKNNSGEDVVTNTTDKYVKRLTLSGRFQVQFADLGGTIENNPIHPVSTEHFLLRRVYLGAKVDLVNGFSGFVNYDFANVSFDAAYIRWKKSDALMIDAGLEKAPFDYEETTSSGNLKAIERSTVTRYFDEPNNGRRLGAASYRTGLYASGTQGLIFYNVAVTNPERNEYSGDGTSGPSINTDTGVQGASNNTTNNVALYGTVGVGNKYEGGSYKFGVEAGDVPDQGGPAATGLGQGYDISLVGAFADVVFGNFNLQGEYLSADDKHGVSATVDAKPHGYWIQPSFYVIPKVLEAVVRYSTIDSDHRGVSISDGIRSAPSGGTMDKLSEWYIGGNWYIDGNDAKLQFGYIHGESKGSTALVAPAIEPKATTDGVRTQMQINF